MIGANPDWEHRFYTDFECRDIIRRELPSLLDVYDSYGTVIQRADLFRVAVVYLYGGVYLDLDVDCLKPLAALLTYECVLAEEKSLNLKELLAHDHAEQLRIANYMFASAPKHLFLLDYLDAMVERAAWPVTSDNHILESTGPGLLSTVFARSRHKFEDIVVLKHPCRQCPVCGAQSCQFGDFAQHLHHGSWRGSRQTSQQRPADPVPARGAILALSRNGRMVPGVHVLECYADEPSDGLSSVQKLVEAIGPVIPDSRGLKGETILVPGIPFLYEQRLSPDNRNVVCTTFESSQLPRVWVEAINRSYHAVIVPHGRVKATFAGSGVAVPIFVAGLGFNRLPASTTKTDALRVGFLGTPVRRKNLKTLYEACRCLLADWPELKLAVHVGTWYDWLSRGDWDEMRNDPMVDWTEGRMTPEALGAWYGSLSCYAYPSSAEGWSFTPRESLFVGVPTLISDIPLHEELKASGFFTMIEGSGTEAAGFESGEYGKWTRIDRDSIVRALTSVLSDLEGARSRAEAGAKWIETRWSKLDAQRQMAAILADFVQQEPLRI